VDAAIRRYGQPLPHDPAFIEHAAQRHPKGLKRRARESSALAQEHKAKTD
jgi:hypothetical protein